MADIFKCIFLNENKLILIKILLEFVLRGPIIKIPALVQIMVWHRPGYKPLSETVMVILLTHICGTWPQWVHVQAVCWLENKSLKVIIISPAQRSCWGGILVSLRPSVRLSVRPSVRRSRMPCPLCNIHSSRWILSILGTNDHYHWRVCRAPWPLTLTYIFKVKPPPQRSCWGVYWFLLRSSVRPSICPACRVRSVTSTVLYGFFPY